MFTYLHLTEALLDIQPGGHSAGATLNRLAHRAGWKFDPAATAKDQMAGMLEQILDDLRTATIALAHATEPEAIERACRALWDSSASGAVVDEGHTWDQLVAGDSKQADRWRTDVRAAITAALAAPTTQEDTTMTKPADTTELPPPALTETPAFEYLGFLRGILEDFPDLEAHASIELHHDTVHEWLGTLTGHTIEHADDNRLADGQPADLLREFLVDIITNVEPPFKTSAPATDETPANARKRLLRLAEEHAGDPTRARIFLDIADRYADLRR